MKYCQINMVHMDLEKSLSLKTYGCFMCGALVEVIKVEILLQKNKLCLLKMSAEKYDFVFK